MTDIIRQLFSTAPGFPVCRACRAGITDGVIEHAPDCAWIAGVCDAERQHICQLAADAASRELASGSRIGAAVLRKFAAHLNGGTAMADSGWKGDPLRGPQLRRHGMTVQIRSARHPRVIVTYTLAEFRALRTGVKAGEFDDLEEPQREERQ